MLILGIDTATKVATVALIRDNQLLGETFLQTDNNHSLHLLPLIDGLLNFCQVRPDRLDALAVAIGPGSFTGLRIGLATGKALAGALDIPLVGIPTLDGLAYNLAGVGGMVCPVLDARKNQVYSAIYSWDKDQRLMTRQSDYLVVTPAVLAGMLQEFEKKEPFYFLGDGAPVYEAELTRLLAGKEVFFAHQPNGLARGAQIAWLGREKIKIGLSADEQAGFHNLIPLYLRLPEAEVNLLQKQKQVETDSCR